jgi:cytochrome c oxidase subunit 4
MMHKDSTHISEYKTLGIVLLILLFLTFTTIEVTSFHLMAATVLVALIIAGVKGYIVLTYFMHLKYEGILLRVLVGAVFLLYAVIVTITFFDYLYR